MFVREGVGDSTLEKASQPQKGSGKMSLGV